MSRHGRTSGRGRWAGAILVVAVSGLTVGGLRPASTQAPVAAADRGAGSGAVALDFDYYRQNVEPIFYKDRGVAPGACVMCHTWQAGTPLNLVPLQEDGGRVYWTEEQSRRNFEVVSGLVAPGFPDNSRLLRKPLAAEAGGTEEHVGGKYWESKDDPEWRVIADWVRSGTAAGIASRPPPPTVDFEFFQACVQKIFVNPVEGAVGCTSCHGGGGERGFASEIPGGRDFWNEEESRRNFAVVMRFIDPGYPLQSIFLQMALHPDAGGTPMHAGGIRWQSQDDPEWQALAEWIRGERSGSTCPEALQF